MTDREKPRNDSSLTITYGDFAVQVMIGDFERMVQQVSELPPEELSRLRTSVDAAIRETLPKIKRGKFSKQIADDFYADMMLWEVLKQRGMT